MNASLAPRSTGSELTLEIASGSYKAWVEFKEPSQSQGPFWIFAFGLQVELILNGGMANSLLAIEDRAADALRLKGKAKAQAIAQLSAELGEIHKSGSNDPRIRDLAQALKIKLPPRGLWIPDPKRDR